MFADIEAWAFSLNTALLIILALMNTYIARKQRAGSRDLTDLKRSIGVNRRWTDGGHRIRREDTGERRRVGDGRGAYD